MQLGPLPPSRLSDEQIEREASLGTSMVKRLPPTPIYPQGSFQSVRRSLQRPKLLRDILFDHLCDWEFHDRQELDKWMPERQWVKAVCDLVDLGYTFDNRDGLLRLRKLRDQEPRPSVVDVISGVASLNQVGEVLRSKTNAGNGRNQDSLATLDGVNLVEADELPLPTGLWPDDKLVLDVSGQFDISLPAMVTEMTGVLARRGAGKTYLAMVIAEQFLFSDKYQVPFVWIDPTGVGWGFLAYADGRPLDRSVVLLGGRKGRSLHPSQGRAVARMVIDLRPIPIVLDLSDMAPEQQHEFVADFLSELYLQNREPLHVFIDEADIYAPQSWDSHSKHQRRCLSVVDNFVRRGRTHGLGGTLITQRAAVLNKNVLTQVGQLFLLQTQAPQDLKAIASWFTAGVDEEQKTDCLLELPIMPSGMAYYASGGAHYRFGKFQVRSKQTFDSSYTPTLLEPVREATLAVLPPEIAARVDAFLSSDISSDPQE